MLLRDPNTLDLKQQPLQIAEDVLFWPVQERGELVYRIEIPKLHRFFRVGRQEYLFLSLLDGQTTIPQACGLAAAELGNRAPTADQALAIGRWLLKNELAYLPTDGPHTRGDKVTAASSEHQAAELFGRLNPFWIKIPLPRIERWIESCAKFLRPLFAPPSVVIGVLLICTALLAMGTQWTVFSQSSTNVFHKTNWVWFLGCTYTLGDETIDPTQRVEINRLGGEPGDVSRRSGRSSAWRAARAMT